LSRKGNKLYNVMPDIVSRLSDPAAEIDEDKFKEIMKYIIGLIDKDKHSESLVEKLCHRFHATTTERQWRDIGFCLSIFNYNDKAAKRFIENFSCFSDKLHEDSLYEAVLAILTQCKKLTKQETKLAIEEMGNKVEEARAKMVEDHTAGTRAKQAKEVKTTKKIIGKTPKRPPRARKAQASSDEENDEDSFHSDQDENTPKKATRKSMRASTLKPGKAANESSDDEDFEDQDEKKTQSRRLSNRQVQAKGDKKQKKAVNETSSDSEAEEAEEDVDENSPKNAKKTRVSGRNSKKILSPDTNTPPVKPSRSSGRSRRVK